jgi:uncharacterized protein YbaR (Trm112 family)/SAM-dependent methyltransferase
MAGLRYIGLDSIAWSLRRLHCPVSKRDLVLEVGSGGNPYFRSNVLLDAYEETRERHWVPLVSDRPTVLGFVENLPFRNKAFDFVVASHVLEHSTDPERFLKELQRVAKAGYIEVPDAFMERVNPYRDHRLEITVRDNRLLIRKKADWLADPELVELYEDRVKPVLTRETMRKHPFDFHVRYYWNGEIDYEVLNPEVDANWNAPESSVSRHNVASGIRPMLKQAVLKLTRTVFAQFRRNAKLDLTDVLACPGCHGVEFTVSQEQIKCNGCGSVYPVRNGMPVMYPPVVTSDE